MRGRASQQCASMLFAAPTLWERISLEENDTRIDGADRFNHDCSAVGGAVIEYQNLQQHSGIA